MNKDIVWVSKELKEQIQSLDEGLINQEEIKSVINKFVKEVKTYDEEVEESVVLFKHHAKKTKEKYTEVVETEITAMDELWESLDQKRYEISKKINGLRERISTTKGDLLELKKLTEGINVYGLTEMIELIDKIKYMSPKDKELLQYVFSHGKRG